MYNQFERKFLKNKYMTFAEKKQFENKAHS